MEKAAIQPLVDKYWQISVAIGDAIRTHHSRTDAHRKVLDAFIDKMRVRYGKEMATFNDEYGSFYSAWCEQDKNLRLAFDERVYKPLLQNQADLREGLSIEEFLTFEDMKNPSRVELAEFVTGCRERSLSPDEVKIRAKQMRSSGIRDDIRARRLQWYQFAERLKIRSHHDAIYSWRISELQDLLGKLWRK